MTQVAEFTPREVTGKPSTARVACCYERYLLEPLYIDGEYIRLYTQRHREVSHWEEQERRAECHAYALERLTPVIREGELIVGSKTRYVRGAIPYANYASEYIVRELRREQHDAQDAVTDLGTGGGIARGREMARTGEFEVFCHKFLISREDKAALADCAAYWLDKCMQAEGDRLWKTHYPHADWITKGWQTVLYSAPHDPAPEGRLILDFETILGQGLSAFIRRCEEKIAATMTAPSSIGEIAKVHFWRAAARTLQATITWGRNYGRVATEMAADEPDPQRREELQTIAAHCLSFGDPPQSFREALQHYWFAYLAGHIEGAHLGYSVGRFDRYMYPFFRRDRESGGIADADAMELLELLRVKHTEIEYAASFSWEGLGSGNLFQNLILGGYTAEGRPADNELSRLIVRAAIHTPTTQPTLSIWWTPGLSEEFLFDAAECVKTGVGFPAWFNTDIYIKHELVRNPGLGIGFIREYAAMGGCTEPVLEGCSYGVVQPGFINLLKVFELALHGGADPRTGIVLEQRTPPSDYQALAEEFKYFLSTSIRCWQEYWNIVMEAHAHTTPLIFCSAVMRDCIERGRNMDHGGLLNNATPTTLSSGMVNVANSLAAVRSVFTQGRGDLDEIRKALRADWQEFAPLRRQCREAPKWGNDNARADELFRELWDFYCTAVEQGPSYLGDHYDPSMLAISTPAPFGKACLATPDGRGAGEPLADGVTSPHPGTDTNGPTAVLRSVQTVDHTRIRGGLHNMKFHPTALRGRAGSLKLLQMIKTLFETQTAFQIQFNVVDSRMLRDAQAHPREVSGSDRAGGGLQRFLRRARQGRPGPGHRTHGAQPVERLALNVLLMCATALGQCGGDWPPGGGIRLPPTTSEYRSPRCPSPPRSSMCRACPRRTAPACALRCSCRAAPCAAPGAAIPKGRTAAPQLQWQESRCRGCLGCARACPHSAVRPAEAYGRVQPRFDRAACRACAAWACLDACPNGAIQRVGRSWSSDELLALIRKDTRLYRNSGGGVTFTGGEPLLHDEFVSDVARNLREWMIHTAIETCGFWEWNRARECLRLCDLVFFDLKAVDDGVHRRFTGCSNELILANLRALAETWGDRVVVSIPIVPQVNDSTESIGRIGAHVRGLGLSRVRLLPYHNLGRGKYAALGLPYPHEPWDVPVPRSTLEAGLSRLTDLGLAVTLEGWA